MESPLGIELRCTKSPKNEFLKKKSRKPFLNDSKSTKIREKDSGVTFEEREGKDKNPRHPFNLAKASCAI